MAAMQEIALKYFPVSFYLDTMTDVNSPARIACESALEEFARSGSARTAPEPWKGLYEEAILRCSQHWLIEMVCNHDEHTDEALCFCGWRSAKHFSVGEAVVGWAKHVAEILVKNVPERPAPDFAAGMEAMREAAIKASCSYCAGGIPVQNGAHVVGVDSFYCRAKHLRALAPGKGGL